MRIGSELTSFLDHDDFGLTICQYIVVNPASKLEILNADGLGCLHPTNMQNTLPLIITVVARKQRRHLQRLTLPKLVVLEVESASLKIPGEILQPGELCACHLTIVEAALNVNGFRLVAVAAGIPCFSWD